MEYEIICTCCMGAGLHETYDEPRDRWIQEECQPCNGKGYITQERSLELYKLSEIQPEEKIK